MQSKQRQIRMTDTLHQRIKRNAESEGVTVAEFMRRASIQLCDAVEAKHNDAGERLKTDTGR